MALNLGHDNGLFDLVVVVLVAAYTGIAGVWQSHKVVAVVGERPIYYREIHARPEDVSVPAGKDLLRLLRDKERDNLKRRIRALSDEAGAGPKNAKVIIRDQRFAGVMEELQAEQPRK